MPSGNYNQEMRKHMQTTSDNRTLVSSPASRLNELGITLPAPPTPLGAYVESSDTGNLLFLSGTLPIVNRKLAVSGRLGENLAIEDGQKAARIAALNALAAAKGHIGDLDRIRKLVKLTVLLATTESFAEHAAVADGASDLFVQIFGRDAGHVRLVYGVQSLPIGAPAIVDTIFEIAPVPQPDANNTPSHEIANFAHVPANVRQ
ncbi:MAG: endoribonuclease [Verrucomicrobiales bacterium]|nr:endoribonuclease [Verrucomicrobiales bacterium]